MKKTHHGLLTKGWSFRQAFLSWASLLKAIPDMTRSSPGSRKTQLKPDTQTCGGTQITRQRSANLIKNSYIIHRGYTKQKVTITENNQGQERGKKKKLAC